MAFTDIRVFTNCDMATIVWRTDADITGCRGFALERQVDGAVGDATDSFVKTWVGFKGGAHRKGESQPSTVWPIARFIWSDLLVSQGQKVRYRVVPMIGPAKNLVKAPQSEWSPWSDWAIVSTGQSKGFEAYFNRGIVSSQFLARQFKSSAEFKKMLTTNINTKGSANRDFLSGPMRIAVLALLDKARRDGVKIYLALYELNDPELIDALTAIGGNCNLILGSGAYKGKKTNKKTGVVTPAVPDENKKVRAKLKKSTHINVFDRLVKSPHFAHNKFVVFCDRNDKPVSVLSGSLNWTVTGLCTQVNNSILVENPDIAADYLKRWNELKAAGDGYPKSLAKNGSKPGRNSVGGAPVTAWNVPCLKYVDLADASSYIRKAQQGVLFLMFNPGVGDGKKRAFSLLQEIDLLANSGRGIFIHGVVNQEQKAGAEATTTIVNKGKKWPPVPVGEITPKILTDAAKNWFKAAYMFNLVMIHSKVVVIDPFGPAPVVMTGSHNDGPKASMSNDDNLLIIENAPGLAAEYAVNIMSVQGHYKWLYNAYLKARARTPAGVKKAIKISPQYDGNEDDDKWQAHFRVGPNLAELDFWLGTTSPLANKPAKTTRHRK